MKRYYLLCLIFIGNIVNAQYEELKTITYFASRIDNPIKINSQKNGDDILFYAENRSNYPYIVEAEFGSLVNMTTDKRTVKELVYPGRCRIATLTIREQDQRYDYQLKSRYYFGQLNSDVDMTYPYLFPLKPGYVITPYKMNPNSSIYLINHFNVSEGDTIYCMRKGYVAASSQMFHEEDRISKTKSIEIMHKDGTVMVYENIDATQPLIDLNQTVYPGQAIGVINEKSYLRIHLCSFEAEGRINGLPILFIKENGIADNFGHEFIDSKVVHPEDIIAKEMTKRERKKYKQGKLAYK